MKKIKSTMIAIMFNSPLSSNTDFFGLAYQFRTCFQDILGNISPVGIPTQGDNIPVDIPRFVMQNNDMSLIISAIRFDFNFISDNSTKNFIPNLETHLNKIGAIIDELISRNSNIPSYRVGVVLSGEMEKADYEKIENLYINKENLANDYKDLNFGYRKVFKDNSNFKYNEWIRFEMTENKQFIFQLDINSRQENISFKIRDIHFNNLTKRMEDFIND